MFIHFHNLLGYYNKRIINSEIQQNNNNVITIILTNKNT